MSLPSIVTLLALGCSGAGRVGGVGRADANPGTGGADAVGAESGTVVASGGNGEDGATDQAQEEAGVDGAREAGNEGGGVPRCGLESALCDDFEGGSLGHWTRSESGGTFAVDGTHAFSGQSAAMLTIPAGRAGGFLVRAGAPLFPLPANAISGRLMIYFESLPIGHFDTIRGAPAGGGTPWYNIGGQNRSLMFNYYSGADDCRAPRTPNQLVVTGKWQCWEWKYDGVNREMDLWIDGTLARQVIGTGDACQGANAAWTAPTFGSIRLGQYNAQTFGSETRIWMDDIVLGTGERLGCAAASLTTH